MPVEPDDDELSLEQEDAEDNFDDYNEEDEGWGHEEAAGGEEEKLSKDAGDDTNLPKRKLLYPKLSLKMSLAPTRSMHAYVRVRKFVLGQWFDCGVTESRPMGLGTQNDFETEVDVQYHAGIDDYQRIGFSIYDGDYYNTKNGYFFAKMDVGLSELLFGEDTYSYPIYREDDVLCTLGITVKLSYDAEEIVTLPTDDFTGRNPELSPEEIAAEKLKIAFFKDEPPTFAKLQRVTPHFYEAFGTYVFRVHALNLLSQFTIDPDLLIPEATQVRLAMCMGSTIRQDSDPKLKALWTSMPVSKIYDVVVLEVKISHEDLTGERDVNKDGDPEARLVFQVLVKNTGTAAEMDKRELIVSTVSVKVLEILGVARKIKKAKGGEAKGLKVAVDFKQARNMAKKTDDGSGAASAASSKKKKKKGGGDDDDYDSFDEEIEKLVKPAEKESVEEDEGGASGQNNQSQANTALKGKGKKSPFGSLTLFVKRDDVSVKCEPGDFVYIEKLNKKLAQAKATWIKQNRKIFIKACNDQSKTLKLAERDIGALSNGYTVSPTIIMDLHSICVQHMQYLYKRHFDRDSVSKTDSTYEDPSSVVDAALAVQEVFTLFNRDGLIEGYASGVLPPKAGYPTRGNSRQIGLPLCQEAVLAHIDSMVTSEIPACGTKNDVVSEEVDDLLRMIDPNDDLLACLDPQLPEEDLDNKDDEEKFGDGVRYMSKKFRFQSVEQSSWGGEEYASTMRYSSLADFRKGIMEAVSIYQPGIDIESYLKLRQEAADEGKEAAEVKTTILTSNIGTVLSSEELSNEIWNNWQKAEKFDWEPLLDSPPQPRIAKNVPAAKKGREPVPLLELFSHKKECRNIGNSDIKALEVLLNKAEEESSAELKKAVVWVVGVEPPRHVIKKLFEPEGIFDKQLDPSRVNVALIIVLAAETRIDIEETKETTLNKTSFPFHSFFEGVAGEHEVPGFLEWKGRQKKHMRERRKLKKGKGLSRTSHRPADNIMVLQWLAFSEILGQVFDREFKERHAIVYQSPKVDTVERILEHYFDLSTALGIVDRAVDNEDGEGASASQKSTLKEETEEEIIARGGIMGFYDRLRPKKKVEEAKKPEKVHNIIEGYSEFVQVRERFQTERKPLFMAELRFFLSDFLDSGGLDKDALKKSDLGNKGCQDCVVA